MAKKYIKPTERAVLGLTVLAKKQISPNFVRLTVGGEAMEHFVFLGFDQWFRVFLPNGDTLKAPTRSDGLWMAQYFLTPKSKRPVGRNLTVRGYRAQADARLGPTAEMDVDLYIHDPEATTDKSAMAAWALTVQPGDRLAILDEGRMHNPGPEVEWQLLAGDESAMPAILGILESSDVDQQGHAFVELADEADAQDVVVPPGFTLTWLARGSTPGAALLDAIRSAPIPDSNAYAFVVGPTSLTRDAKKYLTKDRGLPRECVTCSPYWR